MEEVVVNELTHEGMRRVRVMGDAAFEAGRPVAALWRNGVLVPEMSAGRRQVAVAEDAGLGLFSIEVAWPVFDPWEVAFPSHKKFRRLMMVNFVYGVRVSDVVRRAVQAFWVGTKFFPEFAWVAELPEGAVDGVEVHGVQLLEASEWMPGRCVAVGG